MESKLRCYQLKIDYYIYKMFYVSPIVIIKKKPIIDTHKINRKEPKHTTPENHQFTKEDIKRGRK